MMQRHDWTMFWRRPLPIDAHLDRILDALTAPGQVVVCQAATGSGKTTRIVQAAVLADPDLAVIMTQPRRAAVRWNATQIAKEMDVSLGSLVGYSLMSDDHPTPTISRSTRLELLVDKSLVNRITRRQGELPRGLIVVDEAHERSITIDLLLGLIKQGLPQSPGTKVLILSATIDMSKFEYFFGPGTRMISVAADTPYHVRVSFQPLICSEKTKAALRVTQELIGDFIANRLKVNGDDEPAVTKGVIIVLLPGHAEIEEVLDGLTSCYPATIELLSCMGSSSTEDFNKVQTPVPENTLRIVCGTEILRSSVTVPGAIAVVDSLELKRKVSDKHGISLLTLVKVSHAEAMQGKGRVGRTGPGIYLPMCTEAELAHLQRYPLPAILREPLDGTVLIMASLGQSIAEFELIDRPDLEMSNAAVKKLIDLGALESADTITDLGRRLLDIPLDPEHARILLRAKELGLLGESVVLTTLLEAGAFHFPKITNELPDQNGRDIDCSDYAAIVRMYRLFKLNARETDILPFGRRKETSTVKKWCSENRVKLREIRQAEERMLHLKDAIADSPRDLGQLSFYDIIVQRDFEAENLSRAVLCGRPNGIVAYVCTNKDNRVYRGSMDKVTINSRSLCCKLPVNPPFALICNLRAMADGKWTLATFAAPIEPKWIVEELPHLCDVRPASDTIFDLNRRHVKVRETVELKSLPMMPKLLDREMSVDSGDKAMRALAKWIAEMAISLREHELINLSPNSVHVLRRNYAQQMLVKEVLTSHDPIARRVQFDYSPSSRTDIEAYLTAKLSSMNMPISHLLDDLTMASLPAPDEAVASWRAQVAQLHADEHERQRADRRADEQRKHERELELEQLRIRREQQSICSVM